MKGFRDSTKMMKGHNFARGGHTLQAHFPSPKPAPGLRGAGPDTVGGLTRHGDANDGPTNPGHAAVHREVPSTTQLEETGGKTPLSPGYKKGGHHFHVHKHYHVGGKVHSTVKHYGGDGGSMQHEKRFTRTRSAGGFGAGTTGSSRPKIARGGRMKKATGGTINKVAAGGALYKKGGHSKEMKQHLDSPAPKGHKGLGAMIRRGR